MIKKCITLSGEIINIGEWDYQRDKDGNITNPLPKGAIEEEIEVVFSGEKYIRAETAYRDLRRLEYPPIADQLDAIWKGKEAMEEMRTKIMKIKTKYPKPV